jgi:hypothetical protein
MPDSPELSLTQNQQDRLNAIIGQKLDDCLRDYEKIRKARAANPHGPTRPLELQRRQSDIEELVREGDLFPCKKLVGFSSSWDSGGAV